MTKPLEILRFHEGDHVELYGSLVPAVVEGHEVDEACMLWVVNRGRACTVTVMKYGWDPFKPGKVVTGSSLITVRKRSSISQPSEMVIGMFAPGPIKYDRYFGGLTVCAFRFDPKPPDKAGQTG
jgi:hypothetical protein